MPPFFRQHRALALTLLALLVCYAKTLYGLVGQWIVDEDMGHGFVVPFVALWIVWRERERWQSIPARPSYWGVPLLAAAAALQCLGALGGGLFISSIAMMMSLLGIILCFAGFAYLRVWAFPLLLLVFMLPKLAIVYNQVTLPLQLLASRMAAFALTATGIAVIRAGNILQVGNYQVEVAEACSGIRYLLPLGFLAVVFAYMSDPKVWMRVALLAAMVPLAVVANAARVAVISLLGMKDPALASGFLHGFSGWLIFVVCLGVVVLLQRLFNRIYARFQA